MKYYTPQHKQLTLDLVRSSLDNLDKSNRWVQMGDLLPWADIEKKYNSRLDNKEKGAGAQRDRPSVLPVSKEGYAKQTKVDFGGNEGDDGKPDNGLGSYLCEKIMKLLGYKEFNC